MDLLEAFAQIDALNIEDAYADFSTLTDDDLLHVRMNIELSSYAEAQRFISELRKRGLEEKYYAMRNLKE